MSLVYLQYLELEMYWRYIGDVFVAVFSTNGGDIGHFRLRETKVVAVFRCSILCGMSYLEYTFFPSK